MIVEQKSTDEINSSVLFLLKQIFLVLLRFFVNKIIQSANLRKRMWVC